MTNRKIWLTLVAAVVWIGIIVFNAAAADARQSAEQMNMSVDEYIEYVGTASYGSESLDEETEYPDISLEQDNEDR